MINWGGLVLLLQDGALEHRTCSARLSGEIKHWWHKWWLGALFWNKPTWPLWHYIVNFYFTRNLKMPQFLILNQILYLFSRSMHLTAHLTTVLHETLLENRIWCYNRNWGITQMLREEKSKVVYLGWWQVLTAGFVNSYCQADKLIV